MSNFNMTQSSHFSILAGLAFVFILKCCLSASVHNLENSESLQREANPHYRVIGQELVDEDTLQSTSRTSSDVCTEAEKKRIFKYGGCPDVCKPLDFSKFREYSIECGPYLQFGCSLQPCNDKKGLSCSLDDSLIKKEDITLCQGTKVVFDSIDVKTNFKLDFHVDLHAPPVMTDLYILADTTGSMTRAINASRDKAVKLTNVFEERPNVAIGVGEFRDEDEYTNGFLHRQSITTSKNAARKAIQKWAASGGLDRDEANLVALYKIATDSKIGWRKNSRKFVVFFGDWPGHEPTCLHGLKITRHTVIEKMKAKGITVVAVNFGNIDAAPESYPESGCGGQTGFTSGQSSAITSATGGIVVSSKDQTKVVEAIEKALHKVKRVYDVDDSGCRHKLKSVHSPTLPLSLFPKQKQTVKNTVSLKDSICTAGYKFTCKYKYTEGGAHIEGGTTFEVVDIKGC